MKMVNQFDYLSKRVVYSPKSEAIIEVETGRKYTYEEFNTRANRVANALHDLGVKKGDRIAVIALNTLEYWELFFGCQKIGGILAGLNWRLVSQELSGLINDITPRVVMVGKEFSKISLEVSRETSVTHWLVMDSSKESPKDALAYQHLVASASSSPPTSPKLHYDDAMGIVFTGGTTGLPKGALITYQHVAFNTLNTIRDILPGDTYINHLPLFHVGGTYVYPVPLFILGGRVLQMRTWDTETVLNLIQQEKPNFFFAVPTQHRMLMSNPNFSSTDFSSVRFLTSGGEPLPLDIIRAFKETHGVKFKQGFGMTEVGPGCFALDPVDAERKIGSIGTPNFFIDVKVVDPETENRCGPNEVGELMFKGPTVTSGYWNRPKLNEKLLDNEGYFATGDMVRYDDEGYFYVVDRTKDMFISGGENIYPREIEKILEEHPKLAQVQVIGIPDPKWGEVGRIIAVKKSGEDPTAEEIVEFCQGKLAKFKVPKSVVFIDSFTPFISGAGKILKRALREKYSN